MPVIDAITVDVCWFLSWKCCEMTWWKFVWASAVFLWCSRFPSCFYVVFVFLCWALCTCMEHVCSYSFAVCRVSLSLEVVRWWLFFRDSRSCELAVKLLVAGADLKRCLKSLWWFFVVSKEIDRCEEMFGLLVPSQLLLFTCVFVPFLICVKSLAL